MACYLILPSTILLFTFTVTNKESAISSRTQTIWVTELFLSFYVTDLEFLFSEKFEWLICSVCVCGVDTHSRRWWLTLISPYNTNMCSQAETFPNCVPVLWNILWHSDEGELYAVICKDLLLGFCLSFVVLCANIWIFQLRCVVMMWSATDTMASSLPVRLKATETIILALHCWLAKNLKPWTNGNRGCFYCDSTASQTHIIEMSCLPDYFFTAI